MRKFYLKLIAFLLISLVLMQSPALATADTRFYSTDIKQTACYTSTTVGGMTCYQQTVDVSGTVSLSSELVDDAAFTPATSKVIPIGATFDDVAPDSLNEGDIGAPRQSANRNLYTTIRDAAGNERGVNVTAGNALVVDGSSSTQPVSGTVTCAQATAANLNATVVGTGTFAAQAAQSGTWTVQPGNTANTTPWLVTAGHGKTIKTVSGSLTADTDIISAVASKRIKVVAYSFITTDNTGATAILKSNGTGGTELWRVYLKGPDANTPFGANLATTTPGFLFATVAGEKLTLDTSSAATIHYSVSYFDDDAS